MDRGFTTERTITATVDLPSESYRDDQPSRSVLREVLERMDRLPGVEHAAMTSVLPLTGDGWGDMARIAGDNRPVTQLPLESFRSVSPRVFLDHPSATHHGKGFQPERLGQESGFGIEKTAKTLWPGKNPIGQQFSRGDPALRNHLLSWGW